MKILMLGGGPSDALPFELRQLGHEVLCDASTDWYRACTNHVTPDAFAIQANRAIERFQPDVLVLNKGFHGWVGRQGWWHVPPGFLQRARERVKVSVYISWDDPASTPVEIECAQPIGFDLWLTSCPGIPKLFPSLWPRIRAQVHEFWLAWDARTPLPVEPVAAHVHDLVVTGTPYYTPFPPPHYQKGFAGPRRDLVFAALDAGLSVGLYGPSGWLNRRHGGDPRLAPHYRGWVDPSKIHLVHNAARVVLGTHLVEGHRYDSGRCPWILGAGGVLLHELRPGLREEFGGRVAWYKPGDVPSFLEALKGLLGDPARCARMRAAGRQYVLERHTWAHRARRFVELVSGYNRSR